VQKNHAGGDFKAAYRCVAERRGRNIAKVAAGRKFSPLCMGPSPFPDDTHPGGVFRMLAHTPPVHDAQRSR
jgi:hypothetical protein